MSVSQSVIFWLLGFCSPMVRGCSHIMSAKNWGPRPLVSTKSEIGLPPPPVVRRNWKLGNPPPSLPCQKSYFVALQLIK